MKKQQYPNNKKLKEEICDVLATGKNENKERALRYALSLVIFQEVGAGEDKVFGKVKLIVKNIQDLCQIETGYKIESYPTEFINENIEIITKLLPYSIRKKLGVRK